MKSFILTSLVLCLGVVAAFANDKGEAKAVDIVKTLGGKIEYGQGTRSGKVVKVDLSGTNVTNGDLRHLIGLKELRDLDLSGTSISDGTQYIGFMKKLETLDVSGTKVDDNALTKLRGLKNLKSISIAQTTVTDAGLQILGKISTLRDVSVADSRVTESGKSEALKANPNLRFSDAE